VIVYDVALSEAERVREIARDDEEHSETIAPHIDEVIKFMRDRSFTGHSIERPTDEKEAWSVTDKLEWFATEAAREFVQDNSRDPTIVAVLGFARALVTGYAFIARLSGGERTERYIGYENNFTVDPGTLLLDATADSDGVTQLCPWRTPHVVPQARNNNLRVVSIPPHTCSARQRGLVVCKLDLIKNEDVPDWPAGDPRYDDKAAFTEGYGWDIEGRKLCVTHWGTGIGANTWKEAEVVFLFDEFWIRRIAIATAQGLMGHGATPPDLSLI
jgi:hypothetical protein